MHTADQRTSVWAEEAPIIAGSSPGNRVSISAQLDMLSNSLVQQTPLGRPGQPQDIAKVAVLLVLDDAGWVRGERIIAGGGLR